MQTPQVAIFARWPEPGKAKTRLIPRLGAEGAAALYRKLLEMTVGEARTSGLPFHLRVTGSDPQRFRYWLGEDLDVRDQGDGDLGEAGHTGVGQVALVAQQCHLVQIDA